MIIKCWHTILKFRLSLGLQDTLYRIVLYLHETYNLSAEINSSDLQNFLMKLKDNEFDKALKEFTRYVPFRMLSTFYEHELRGKSDSAKNRIIEELSRKDDTAPYRIISAESKLLMNYNWFEYLYSNMLVEYLQRRNPNMPSVIDKIEAPQKRNLTEARNFWKKIIETVEINPCPLRGCGGNPEEVQDAGSRITTSFAG